MKIVDQHQDEWNYLANLRIQIKVLHETDQ